jgi:hypothetical protein
LVNCTRLDNEVDFWWLPEEDSILIKWGQGVREEE